MASVGKAFVTRADKSWLRIYRDAAVQNQRGRCFYCRCQITQATATADHAIPLKHGGLTRMSNIVAACLDCNRAKGSLKALSFKHLLRSNGRLPLGRAVCRAQFRIHRRADQACVRILRLVGVKPTP